MHRYVRKSITLSDGTVLPEGSTILIPDDHKFNAKTYQDPRKFDVERFLKLRSRPGEENRHQFVTTSVEHMGFGHGAHACPGRFFASNEMKIALCFLLLKYEFRFASGRPGPKNFHFEIHESIDPNLTIELRRRREEIDLTEPKKVA